MKKKELILTKINILWQNTQVRYIFNGLISTAVSYIFSNLIFYSFIDHVNSLLLLTIISILNLTFSFLIHSSASFKNKEMVNYKYLSIYILFNILFLPSFIDFILTSTGIDFYIVQLLITIFTVLLNYFILNFINKISKKTS